MMDAQAIDAQAVAQALDKVSFEGWIGAALTLLLGIVAIRILMHLAARALDRLPLDRALSGFLRSAAQIVIYIVLGTMVAGQLGVPVTSLVALLSLFALAISLSIQNVLANVVSGMVILTAKPFAAGDYIELTGAQGEVESIDLMYTHLVMPDGKLVLVPNQELAGQRITNHYKSPLRRMDVTVRVGYAHENAAVTAALRRAGQRMPDVVKEGEKAPFAAVSEYGETGVTFLLRVWMPSQRYWDVYYPLLDAVREELARDGIALTSGTTRVEIGRGE